MYATLNNFKILKSNTRKKGYYRDVETSNSIGDFQALLVEQIYLMHFTDIKDKNQALIKVRSRLRELKKLKKIKEEKINVYGKPKVFYKEKPKHTTLEHVINRNWGYLYVINYNINFRLVNFKNEYELGELKADGFAQLYSDKGKKYSYWFIESDRTNSKNEFDKIKRYNDMYKNGDYVNEYWASNEKLRPDRFPKILIVTDSQEKAKKIKKHIEEENEKRLKFFLITVEEIRKYLRLSD